MQQRMCVKCLKPDKHEESSDYSAVRCAALTPACPASSTQYVCSISNAVTRGSTGGALDCSHTRTSGTQDPGRVAGPVRPPARLASGGVAAPHGRPLAR
jgi:hypothetical protein